MRIALAQIDNIIGDLQYNKQKIIDFYNRAVKEKVDLVLFPELALTGYPPRDLVEKREFRKKVTEATREIANVTTNDTAIIFGSITEKDEHVGTGVYNSAIFAYGGKIRFVQDKTLLPNYDVFDERRYFESSKQVSVLKYKDEVLGISICEDIWNDDDYWKRRRYETDPVEELIKQGATLLVNISASPYAYGRRQERYDMLSTLTKTNNIPLAYVCTVGAQTDLIFDGASMCFNEKGELIQLGKTYAEDFIVYETTKNYEPILDFEKSFEEEVFSAISFGLREYLWKTGFEKVILGLSGGIDSAVVAAIAAEVIGAENVTAVMLPSKISSKGSVEDAEKLIKNLGINSHFVPISETVEAIEKTLSPLFRGTQTGIAEENIQARARGLILMAIANKFNYLLLATGNKSELAVGYATLYGDMNGALEVIGDVYKTQVYKLAEFINRNGEVIPREIITKPPSAELRPGQKDQDTLPPYDLLDEILHKYLEEYKEAEEIIEEIGKEEVVRKVLRMVDLNEYKRFQSAPVLRVSTKAFGYGRRFPIVQGWRK